MADEVHISPGRPWQRMVPRLTMREQIIIRISLRDDVPLRWPSCEDYSAPSPLPSKQRVAGSNPAGRADLRKCLIVEPVGATTALLWQIQRSGQRQAGRMSADMRRMNQGELWGVSNVG